MRRMLLNYLLPIALPFAIYGFWLAYAIRDLWRATTACPNGGTPPGPG